MQNRYFIYNIWKIYCSFCVAMLLQTILCFSKVWNIYPSWVLMILIYWVTILPHKINIGTGFFLGLILDIASDSIIGIHALSLSTIVYLVIHKIHFFKSVSAWIQSFLIIFISFINQSIILLTMYLFIHITYSLKILWNCILDGSIWPIIIFCMHKIYSIDNNKMR